MARTSASTALAGSLASRGHDAAADDEEPRAAWPLRLAHTQGLRRNRGEVLRVGEALYAIVGFDGRNEGYTCWVASDADSEFDTSCTILLDTKRAHFARREPEWECKVPRLPAMDHTGRLTPTSSSSSSTHQRSAQLHGRPAHLPGNAFGLGARARVERAATAPSLPSVSPALPSSPRIRQAHEERESSGAAAEQRRELRSDCCAWERSAGQSVGAGKPDDVLPQQPHEGRALVSGISPGQLTLADLQEEGAFEKQCTLSVVFQALSMAFRGSSSRLLTWLFPAPEDEEDGLLLQKYSEWYVNSGGAWLRQRAGVGAGATGARRPVQREPGAVAAAPPRFRQMLRLHLQEGGAPSPTGGSADGRGRGGDNVSAAREKQRGRGGLLEDLHITIPVVRPANWWEVQPWVQRMPVTFDERGVKETMTVKPSRWSAFVDRQRAKLIKEINDLRAERNARRVAAAEPAEAAAEEEPQRRRAFAASATHEMERDRSEDGDSDAVTEAEEEEEVIDDTNDEAEELELEKMTETMEDWKDLSRYSGKSVSMGTTHRGNEMRIHVVAFAEREDGGGIDFVRLSYRKSVEVRRCPGDQRLSLLRRLVLPFSPCSEGDSSAMDDARWVHLLRRPDIAKFTIALAFRDALEEDGLHLRFCESGLDEEADA